MGALDGEIKLPGVGSVPKKPAVIVGALGAAFVAWKWVQASRAGAEDEETGTDPGFEDGGVLPPVAGGVRPGNDYGIPEDDGTTPGQDSYGFRGTTNSQWSQYALTQLTQTDRWDYGAISAALGRYLGSQPLDSTDQEIVRAAIAVAGYPPVGQFQIKPGGETPITVAPTGLKGTGAATAVDLTWGAVPGAHEYRIYRSGVAQNVGTSRDTRAHVGGLDPATSYRFRVRALTASGKAGPYSDWVTVKTKAAALKAPSGLKVASVGKTYVSLRWNAVSGADGYRMYRSGTSVNVGASRDTYLSVGGLKPNTSYKFRVAATSGNTTGPMSGWITARTKK